MQAAILALPSLFGGAEVLEAAEQLTDNALARASLAHLKAVYRCLCEAGVERYVSFDLGTVKSLAYYSGMVFTGLAAGVGAPVLSGGRYDGLCAQFGRDLSAVGFAIGMMRVLRARGAKNNVRETGVVNVALAKGRLASECADTFIRCGIRAEVLKEDTRKLVLETPDKKFRFFFVKPSDVPTYVEYGVADIGIVGKDTLLEADADLYEMLDLGFEKCRLCLAGFPEKKEELNKPHLRVATKYVHTAKKLFASRGEDAEIIPLHGSIELAPLTGLSDVIFDIVQSGGTLRANGLVVLEEVFDISARLIANKVSLKTKAAILPLIREIGKIVGE